MDEEDYKLKTTIFFIEATSFERLSLWQTYHEKDVGWEEDNMGFWQVVGNLGSKNKPVCVSFNFVKIYGKRICFYYVTSRFSDSEMVEKYLENNYPVKWDNDSRRAMTDAMNFHNAVDACKEAGYKQWERKKKLEEIGGHTRKPIFSIKFQLKNKLEK